MKNIVGVSELDEFILKHIDDKVVLLYFGAVWCGPCKQLKIKLDESDTKKIMPKLVVGHLDVDDELNAKLVKRYKISSLPTQIFIKVDNNKVVEVSRIEGYDFTRLKLNYDSYLDD